MAVERKTIWLGVALAVVLVVGGIVWSSGNSAPSVARRDRLGDSPAGGRSRAVSRASQSKTGEQPEAPPAHVKLAALKEERGQPVDLGRNPFRFRPPPAPPPPPAPTPARPMNQTPVGPAAPAVPAGPPPPPAIPLKFIGLVTKIDGTRIAVLSDGRSPQSGKEGDIILGQYRILKIGLESIEMAYVDGRGKTTIRLTGQ
jgi:hypothetical protein